MRAPLLLLAVLAVLAVGLAGCLTPAAGPEGYEATVRWTTYGIPHVVANDWASLGYGYGYASARDNLCLLAEEWVTVRGERSLHWPPEETYRVWANGVVLTAEQSDAFYRLYHASPDLLTPITEGMRAEVRDLVRGYAAGYNRRLADLGPAGIPQECRGAAWVQPITPEDVVRRSSKLQLLASGLAFARGIVEASPPVDGLAAGPPGGEGAAVPVASAPTLPTVVLPGPDDLPLGSNAYALGAEATASGRGMLLGNPHYPWQGPERFHQLHLTIPGVVDVMGATLHGVPLVLIGFNEHVAWSHTVSTARRFTLFELTLAPGDPTSYLVDGQVEPMQRREVVVPVRLPSGDVEERTRTVWLTRYGPVTELNLATVGAEGVGLTWDLHRAYAIRDANAPNARLVEQFFRFNTATSYDAFKASLDEVVGIPWVNTIAASPDGRAFYADIGAVPHVDDAKLQACSVPLGQALWTLARVAVLDGSTSSCDWTADPAAPQEGIMPGEAMPRTERADWVLNSNDSHWLPNPAEPLEGYPAIIGAERAERSGRTRMGYVLLQERLAGDADCTLDPAVRCDKFTLARLQDALFSNRLYYPELAINDVVDGACALPLPAASTSGALVDLGEACDVLRAWDLRADVGSRGLALFELFWLRAPRTWATPFDPARPVDTPRDYVGADPRVRVALADAVELLRGAGIPLDATTGEARFVTKHGERIPVHGANHAVGSPSFLTVPFEPGTGFQEPVHGNSYIQAVTWDEEGVVAEAVLSYSLSTDPASPHHADQSWLYAAKGWHRLPFREADILADPNLQVAVLRG